MTLGIKTVFVNNNSAERCRGGTEGRGEIRGEKRHLQGLPILLPSFPGPIENDLNYPVLLDGYHRPCHAVG